MQDIYDYILWRGDLTIKQSEFNKIDSLILAQLSYVMFDDILAGPESENYITLQEASGKFWAHHTEEEINTSSRLVKESAFLLKKMADTRRYGNFLLGKYVNRIDYEKQQQFSAMKIKLPDRNVFIAFRGTDDTIVGWREDFNMAYLPQVPSQTDAVDYLEKIIRWNDWKIMLGGHSKGGNLAVYAAVNCKKNLKRRITCVYNFDGPGFLEKMVQSNAYKEVVPLIRTYIPETSIIGKLLEHQEDYLVVKSSQTGIMQHDPLSWKIEQKDFLYAKEIDHNSKIMDATITSWIEKMEIKQREQFVEVLFYLLEINDIRTTQDFTKIKWKNITDLIKSMNDMKPESKKVFNETMKLLWTEANRVMQSNIIQNRNLMIKRRNEEIKARKKSNQVLIAEKKE